MKRWFGASGFLSLLVVALAIYTVWEYKKAQRDEDSSDTHEVKLLHFANDDIEEIQLKRPSETVLLRKEAGQWMLKSPVEDNAEPSAVDAFLYSLQIQKGKVFKGEDEARVNNWVEFGLEPAGTIIVLKGSKKSEAISVSSKNAFDGSFYVRDGEELLLGDRGLAQIVNRDANALRMRRLWRLPDTVFSSAEVQVNNETLKDKFTIKIDGGKWTLEPNPPYPVDPARLESWVAHIQQLTPPEIVTENPSLEDRKNDLLILPSLVATLHFKDAAGKAGKWTVTVGQDKSDETFLFTSVRPTVYKMPSQSLHGIRVGREYFRNGKKAFQFDVEQAAEVEIKTEPLNLKIKKEGSSWRLTENIGDLDQNKLIDLIHALHSLEAQEFLSPTQAKGFKPTQSVIVRGAKGQILLDLSWGDVYKAHRIDNKNMTFRYAKSNLEQEAMGLDATKIASLIDPQLVKKYKVDKK